MKKYLLTSLLGVFTLFGAFVSAEEISCTSDGCDVSSFTFSAGDTFNEFSDTSLGSCSLILTSEDNVQFGEYECNRIKVNGSWIECNYNYYPHLPITFDTNTTFNVSSECSDNSFYPFTATLGVSHSVGTEGDNGNGVIGGSSPSQYLSGGTLALKPALDGLKGTMAEFIPYIAYIGLGIIVACLGFVAIRRLVNWVRAKIFDNF